MRGVHGGAYLLKKDLNSAGAGVEDREYVLYTSNIEYRAVFSNLVLFVLYKETVSRVLLNSS